MKSIVSIVFVLCISSFGFSQEIKKPKLVISGALGVTYENYGLTTNPIGWTGYNPRKPWNQVRFNFKPTFTIGALKIPLNFNFAIKQTNFLGPYAGIGALGNQTFGQFLVNPLNNFSINPKYKWAELQLGTQYLNYTDLTTGDVGVFGAGFDLRPNGCLIKFFTGTSQQAINQSLLPAVPGAYRRNNWMAQIGKEKEGKYKFALTAASGKDNFGSAVTATTILPQSGFTTSLQSKLFFNKGYFFEAEGAQSLYSLNTNAGGIPAGGVGSLPPFFTSDAATVKDFAGMAFLGRKTKNFDISLKSKYLGAGYFTMGYPFQQADRFDATINTRFKIWKNTINGFKTNVVASIGQRVNNMSNAVTKANMLIANLNVFTQFNDKWSLNVNYNNFGFQSVGILPYAIKNVSNDFGLNPTYTWNTSKMSNLLSLNYNFSKYDETDTTTGILTTNNTHTLFLTYVPTFFNKNLAPDFSVLYFVNQLPTFRTTLATFSAGLATPLFNKKVNLRGQLQYTFIKNDTYTANNNVIASCNIDWKIAKQLTWTNFFSTNYFKYGDETGPIYAGANYLETNFRTGLLYKFSTKK